MLKGMMRVKHKYNVVVVSPSLGASHGLDKLRVDNSWESVQFVAEPQSIPSDFAPNFIILSVHV